MVGRITKTLTSLNPHHAKTFFFLSLQRFFQVLGGDEHAD